MAIKCCNIRIRSMRGNLSPFGRRQVIGGFDSGRIAPDAGEALLREVNLRLALLDRRVRYFATTATPIPRSIRFGCCSRSGSRRRRWRCEDLFQHTPWHIAEAVRIVTPETVQEFWVGKQPAAAA